MSVIQTTREDYLVAGLAALAIAIHVLESALPTPLPGVKPGLANVVTIVALIKFGWRVAVWVTALRVLVGSLIIGTFLSPTFILSASGALASITILGLAYRSPVQFGPVGYAVLAAMAHMAAQFLVAYALFIQHPTLFAILPILMTAAVVFGLASGAISYSAVKPKPVAGSL